MDHKMAQRRMLICAAFFSFGTLSGALTIFQLSSGADEQIAAVVSSVFFHQFLLIPSITALFALMLFLAGLSLFGGVCVCFLMILFGFIGGFLESLSWILRFYPLANAAFLAVFALCYLQIGAFILRRSSVLRRQKACSGLMKPDDRYGLAGFLCVFILLILTSLALTYFLFNL